MEVWNDIKDYEGLYQVSDLGRVKSLERVDSMGRVVNEKIRKLSINNNGYSKVTLNKNGNKKSYLIHQLVAITFLGHVPCGYNKVVDHIDNNPLNNHVSNLQLIAQRLNCSKDKKYGVSKYIGVHRSRNKWRAQIRIDGKICHLGLFIDELQAAQAYQNKLNEIKLAA